MFGYEGDDVYVPGPQPTPFSGADTIWELGGNDELRLEGVNPDDVQRHRVGDDLIFHTFLQGPIVRFAGWFAGPDNQVERVVFDDGTEWDAAESSALRVFGTPGDDYVFGSFYGERLEGRGGSDQMFGYEGDDVYVPGPQPTPFSGADTIWELGGNDELRLEGVNPDDVQRHRVGDDLIFHTFLQGPIVRFAGWFAGPDNQVERVVFDDGTNGMRRSLRRCACSARRATTTCSARSMASGWRGAAAPTRCSATRAMTSMCRDAADAVQRRGHDLGAGRQRRAAPGGSEPRRRAAPPRWR